jgi:hypothetical protein
LKRLIWIVLFVFAALAFGQAPAVQSSGDKAIALVKKAVLVVDGDRSSKTVEGGVQFYFTLPDIRMGDGWSATLIAKDSYNVVLDFINLEDHTKASWEVNLTTKEVHYRNEAAKAFSWIPKDPAN